MTLKGGTSNACAACKYQRRKCTSECQLAPYFPADKPEVFKNAHKLFGVKNILSILKNLQDPNQKAEAMTSIICQANIREMFPVHGCCQVIEIYFSQIRALEDELHAVYAQLEFYRAQQHSQVPTSVPSQLELGMAPPNNVNPLPFYQSTTSTQPAYSNAAPVAALPSQQHQSYPGGIVVPANNDRSPFTYIDSKDNTSNSSLWIQNSYPNMNNSNSSSSCPTTQLQQGMGTGAASETQLAMQGIIQDYEDMHPFFESIDDRQSYIGSKDACESSSEDITQSKEHVAENELKSAAACFSLTSVN